MKETFLRLQSFLESRLHMLLVLLLSLIATVFSLEQYAIPIFILWILFIVVADSNFLDILLPLLLLNAMALRTLGQTTYHMNHLWLAVPAVIAIALHFFLYPKRPVLGKSFLPLSFVSVSLLLGGLGVISTKDYFALGSLYYVIFLGIGMLGFYLWMRTYMQSTAHYEAGERMLEILYILGVFCAFSILEHTLQTVIVYQKLMPFPWCNDICEMMIFALPVPFYYARRRFVHFFVPFAFYAAMLPAMSMTAVLVGAVILALGLVYTFVYNPQKRAWVYAAFAFALCAAVFVVIHYRLYSIEAIKTLFASQENGRLDLFRSAWENFKLHPILGVGIGYGTNDGSFMKSFWTHNWLLQILGSLGAVGMLAYGYQMLVRAKLIFKRRTAFRMMVGLSYLGIFLASMFQPGEFCPMPYELLAVALFALLEMTENDTAPCIGGEL